LLAPSGVLFVAPVEQPLVLSHGFVSANIPKASACRKAAHVVRRPRLARIIKQPSVQGAPQPNRALPPPLPASIALNLPPTARALHPVRDDLETARRLADAGRLHEAATICEAHLSESRGSAQAYYLLGLVRDASGDARAIECYRKALYLEPNHYDCLLQMALLLQKNGDPTRAHAFTNRAQRIRPKG